MIRCINTINSKTTTKQNKTIITSKPAMEIKWNHKKCSSNSKKTEKDESYFFPFELMKGKLQLNNVVASDVKEKDQLKMLTLP